MNEQAFFLEMQIWTKIFCNCFRNTLLLLPYMKVFLG